MKQDKETAKQQRVKIAAMLNEGKGVNETARLLGCSTRTVQKVKRIMDDPNEDIYTDRREKNGRPEDFTAETKAAILEMRKVTDFGPRLMWAMIQRDPERWGIIDKNQIPSIATISDWVSEAGLTKKMVGAKDSRGWPIDFEDKPGVIAMDEWGPRYIRGEKIYLVTSQDKFTKLSFGIPVFKTGSINTWKRAIDIARDHLLNGAAPTALWIDNGIGMALAQGWTSQPVRYALSQGTRVVFNAPHHPWKNGRLENWHWRQEVEYWQHVDASKVTIREAIAGFLGHINWYNIDRPHSGLRDSDGSRIQMKAPADLAPWYVPITGEDIREKKRTINEHTGEIEEEEYERLDPQKGIVDMVRMVHNNGRIDLQDQDSMFVSEIFGGQYLRIRFWLDPNAETQIGQVIWQRGQRKEPITVATFNHKIDRKRARGEQLVSDVHAEDFSIDLDNATVTTPPPPLLQEQNWTNSSSRRQPPASASASGNPISRAEFRRRLGDHLHQMTASLLQWIEVVEEDVPETIGDTDDLMNSTRDQLTRYLKGI